MFSKMRLFDAISLPNLLLLFHGILLVNCDFVEFEKFVPPVGPWGRQPIILEEDGGYTNLLVAIHRDVQESVSIIEGIKNMLTLTSQMLYKASDQALYFREISILVPDNWNDSLVYAKSRPNETFQTARIIIRDEKSKGSPPSYPFVRQLLGSESEAEYMYLPSGILTSSNESIQNKNAGEILNLWGHLRWGLTKTHLQNPEQLSPSLSYKSLWKEYMEKSIDFQSFKDKQSKEHTDVTPNFRILRHRDTLSVVILDARENMKENTKFERMKEEFENYVWNLFPAYSWLGVVVVTDQSRKLLPVFKLWESPGFRDNLIIQKLPKRTNSTSSLGNGLIRAKRMLYEIRSDISGSFIFIMSDGSDDIQPTVNDVIQEVTSDGVVIASLPFSTNISENIVMNNSIKQNFTVKDTNQLYRLEDENRFRKVFQSGDVEILPFQSRRFDFSMDRNTSMDSIIVRVRMNDSLGTVLTDFQYYDDIDSHPSFVFPFYSTEDRKVTDILLPEKAIQGFEIQPNISLKLSCEVFSTFRIGKENGYIDEEIRSRRFLKSNEVNFSFTGVPLYVSITKNENPVINVTNVIAIITTPDGVISKLPLLDDGNGPDLQLYDGIYSNYFNSFTTEGEYTVEFQVFSGENSCVLSISTDELMRTSPSRESYVCGTDYTTPLTPFQRFPSTINFTVSAIPPNPVTNLKASIDESKRKVYLSWTPAGEDLTIGRADSYEIRYGKDESDIANNFDSGNNVFKCSSTDLVAHVSPQKEYFCADFSNVNGYDFVVAVRALDSHGNKGNVSDSIRITFPKDKTTVTTAPSVSKVTKTMNKASVSVIAKMTNFVQTQPFLATSIVCVVVCLVVILGLKRYLKKREKTRETLLFTPTPGKNRVSPSPAQSPCLRRSPCTPHRIILEDI